MKKKYRFNKTAETQVSARIPVFYILLFLSFIYLLFYNQFITLEKFSNLVSTFARWGSLSQFMEFVNKYGRQIWGSNDSLVFYLMIIFFIGLIFIELRKEYLYKFIKNRKDLSNRLICFSLVLAGLVTLRSYYAIGDDLYSGDSSYFIYLTWVSKQFIAQGKFFHFWHYFNDLGCNINKFYGFVFSLFAGTLDILLNNIYLSLKLSNLFFRILMGIGTFFFISELTKNRKAGFISAIAVLLSHQLTHSVIYLGRYSSITALAFIPYIYFFLERYINTDNRKYLIYLTFSMVLGLFSNMGIFYWNVLIFVLYFVIRLLFLSEGRLRKLISVGLACFSAVVITSPITAGFFLDKKNAIWNLALDMEDFSAHLSAAKNTFLYYFSWSNFRFYLFNTELKAWQIGYLGLSLLGLLAGTGYAFFKKIKDRNVLPFIILVLVVFIFLAFYQVFGYIIRSIAPVFLYPMDRLMIIFSFYFTAISGVGYFILKDKIRKFDEQKLFIIILMVIFIDLFPTTFQDSFGKQYGQTARPIIDFLKKEYSYENTGRIAPFTTVLCSDKNVIANNNWRTYDSWLVETGGVPNINVHFVDQYKILWPIILSIDSSIVEGLKRSSNYLIPEYLKTGLVLLNTRYLITSSAINPGQFKNIYYSHDLALCEMNYNSIALASRQLKSYPYTNYFNNKFVTPPEKIDFLKEIQIDSKNNTLAPLFIADNRNYGLQDIVPSQPQPLNLMVRSVKIEPDKAVIVLEVNDDCYIRFPFAHYPDVRVWVNGQPADTFETLEGCIFIKAGKGRSEIQFRHQLSELRIILSIISLVFVTGLICLLFHLRKQEQQSLPGQ